MKLNLSELAQPENLIKSGVKIPGFDVAQMQLKGKETPRWIHIGPGNLFRVFIARIADQMIEAGEFWPVTVVLPMNPVEKTEQMEKFDLISLGITLHADGKRDLRAIAGISEALATREETDFARFLEIGRQSSVKVMTFTITEKGYAIHGMDGQLQPAVLEAIDSDPRAYQPHTMALVAGMLLHRFEAGAAPLTLMSYDNFSHNGDKLRDSVLTIVKGWAEKGSVPAEFVDYVSDESQVAFPISCIDKITPRPNQKIADELAELGFEDMQISNPFGVPLAGFVNTEAPEYLIVENKFATEVPPLDKFGVKFVERKACDEFERMKVTTCLNPLHTALAVAGCLLRIPTIDAEMRDPALAKMVNRLGWEEGMPVVTDPGIIRPDDFLREVLEVRFPNRYLPDDPGRIAMDTSQKLPIRFGETIKSYLQTGRDLEKLQVIPLVFALWCRYLLGIADDGEPFEVSPDPLREELQAHLADVKLGTPGDVHAALSPILSNPAIFGIDLYQTPLAGKVENLFKKLVAGTGAVRTTIDEEMN